MLTGNLIKLRALEPEDLKHLELWENSPENWLVSNTLVPFSTYILRLYIENSASDIYTTKQLRLIIETRKDPKPVGAIDLFDFDPFHQRAGIGILIHSPSDRQKGYAKEAVELIKDYCFKTLLLKQLYCNILVSNKNSIDLFQKSGFEICGNKKSWHRTENGYEDEYMLQCIN